MVPQVTLFWSSGTEIMFPGWPGQRFYSYLSVLACVFLVALAIEWLSHARLIKPSTNDLAVGFQQTLMYSIRVALAFLVMLAVMSFNIGVFIAAVAGYSVGFLIFGSQVFKKSKIEPYENLSDLPPLNC